MRIADVAELFAALDLALDADQKAQIATLTERDLYQLHLGVSALIRSLAYYRNESTEGKARFQALGFPDDGSAILVTLYWMYVRQEDVEVARFLDLARKQVFYVPDQVVVDLANEYIASVKSPL